MDYRPLNKSEGLYGQLRRLFSPASARTLAHCQQYIMGLFHACRSNVERLSERLPDSSYDALHHFISESIWGGLAVMGEVARQVQATLGEVAGEQGLLLDECGWEKAGTKSVGWAGNTSGRWAYLPYSAGVHRQGWSVGSSTCPRPGVTIVLDPN